jgi:cob(I)alamin adenosyltransferase
MEKAAVYTRTGDKGMTSLYSGERVPKQCLRVEAYGSIDAISSNLGLARALLENQEVRETVYHLQEKLMQVMADVASLNIATPYITDEDVKELEHIIDAFDAKLEPLTHFVIPGGKKGAAALDVARTTTRRAERNLLRLQEEEPVSQKVIIWINRLSDLCFILERVENEVAAETGTN